MIKKCCNIIMTSMLIMLTGCGKIVPNVDTAPDVISTAKATITETTTSVTSTSSETKTTSSSVTTDALTTSSQVSSSSSSTAAAASAAPQTTAATTASPTTAAETTATAASSSEAVTETTTAAAEGNLASGYNSDWQLMLANKTHTIGDYQPPELVTLTNGTQVDSRMYPDLQAMFDVMYASGYAPYVREAYRTYEDQQEIMDTRISQHLAEGYSYEGAVEQAEKYVAVPGTSEHQLGLAVDINAADGNEWGVYWWLSVHAYEYGFILRYPQDKEYVTGYDYEPWHYRYVGKETAAYLYQNGLTLEDYLGAY